MGARKIQDETEVMRWFEEGMTYERMAEIYKEKYHIEITPTAFAVWRNRRGLKERNLHDDNLMPWRVAPQHRHMHVAVQLRTEARRRAGATLSPHAAKVNEAFVRRLKEEGLVVHYDPNTPDGWFFIPREACDSDIVRHPATRKE